MELTNEQTALLDLLPSVNLTTEEKEALAMWTSDPPVYPRLTEEECDELVKKARIEKGRRLFQAAYGRQAKGQREFVSLDAKTFREWVQKRGNARAVDLGWPGGNYQIDGHNEAILKLLALYFTRDDRFGQIAGGKYSLRKGILLVGDTGVGKTVLMELCSLNPHVCYTRHDCQQISEEYAMKEGGPAIINYYSSNGSVSNTDTTFGQETTGRFFDDLGQESNAKHFGNERNVMAEIIQNRYRAGEYWYTHFTSNHTLPELGKLYGSRVEDRLREMCNVIEFPASAKSRRG